MLELGKNRLKVLYSSSFQNASILSQKTSLKLDLGLETLYITRNKSNSNLAFSSNLSTLKYEHNFF